MDAEPDGLGPGEQLVLPGRLQRLRDELVEEGVAALDGVADELVGLVELSYAMRPPVHEGQLPSYGVIIAPGPITERSLSLGPLDFELVDVDDLDSSLVRRFADGLASFVVRTPEGVPQLVCFGRVMVREFDLVLLRMMLGAVIVQRHPSGLVRTFGPAGVVRWDGNAWHQDDPLDLLIERVAPHNVSATDEALRLVLLFAIHELSPRRIGATLIVPGDGGSGCIERVEPRFPRVPAVGLAHPGGAAALASALAQSDGAAIFDEHASLVALGAQLVPSRQAREAIDLVGGSRHTSALRYSHDDPDALIVVVSEDGPVTFMRGGRAHVLTASARDALIG